MLTDLCQRWTSRRASYRPRAEPFDPCDYEVAAIEDDTTARAFVQENHYSASYPAARFRYGLYSRGRGGGELVGVAVFSTPARAEVTTNWMRGEPTEHVELGRFVLLDHVRANAESWMIARCFDWLRREGITGVVSFSDPCPRVLPGPDGRLERVFGGAHRDHLLGDERRLRRSQPRPDAPAVRQWPGAWPGVLRPDGGQAPLRRPRPRRRRRPARRRRRRASAAIRGRTGRPRGAARLGRPLDSPRVRPDASPWQPPLPPRAPVRRPERAGGARGAALPQARPLRPSPVATAAHRPMSRDRASGER